MPFVQLAGRGTSVAYKVVLVVELLSHVLLFVTPWTIAHQVPLTMEFSQQEYWSGLPFPSQGHLPDPGIEPVLHWQAGSSSLTHQGSPLIHIYIYIYTHMDIVMDIHTCIETHSQTHGHSCTYRHRHSHRHNRQTQAQAQT